jgi:hypothetical protein
MAATLPASDNGTDVLRWRLINRPSGWPATTAAIQAGQPEDRMPPAPATFGLEPNPGYKKNRMM